MMEKATKKLTFPQLVPWRNKKEWLEVYHKFYSTNADDLQWALDQVSVWQARSPASSLLGVETTAGLVRATIMDLNHTAKDTIFEHQNEVSMVYSMAITRFVNLICEMGKRVTHLVPIRKIAAEMRIPEWLVNLRHSSTHRYSIPSLDMLRAGSSLALDWLKVNYWEQEAEIMEDFVRRDGDHKNSIAEKIGTSLHEFQRIQYSVLYGEKGKVQRMNRCALQAVLKTVRRLLRGHSVAFLQVLSKSGYLVPSYHHLESLLKPGESSFLNNASIQLPLSLEKFWTPVFHLFDQNDHLQCLLNFLLEPCATKDEFSERLSAAWALHILNVISSQESGTFMFAPSLNWLQILETALKKPTQYSSHVLAAICQNVNLSEDVKEALMALVAIFLGGVTNTKIPNKVNKLYTKDDMEKIFSQGTVGHSKVGGPWRNYSGKLDWQSMPIGCIIQAEKGSQVSKKICPPEEVDDYEALENPPIFTEPSETEEIPGDENEHVEESGQKDLSKVTDLTESMIFM